MSTAGQPGRGHFGPGQSGPGVSGQGQSGRGQVSHAGSMSDGAFRTRQHGDGHTSPRINRFLLGATVIFLPLLVPQGPAHTALVDLFIVLYLVVAIAGILRRGRAFHLPAGLAIAIIVAASAIATGASQFHSIGELNMVIDLYCFALFFMVANDVRRDPVALRTILAIWAGSALFWAVLGAGPALHIIPTSVLRFINPGSIKARAEATTANPNLAASYYLVSFFVYLASPWPRRRWVRVAGAIWLLLAIYGTGSNGALLGMLITVGFLVIFKVARRVGGTRGGRLAMVGVLLLVASVTAAGTAVYFNTVISPLGQVASFSQAQQGGLFQNNLGRLHKGLSGRLHLWATGLRNATAQGSRLLLVGVGPGASKYTVDYKGLHDDLLSYFVERGVFALGGLILLDVLLIRWSWRLLMTGSAEGIRLQFLGASALANLLFSLSHQTLHFRHVWVAYALLWVAYDMVQAGILVKDEERATTTFVTQPSFTLPFDARYPARPGLGQ